jgi:YHS domain-containing protein
VSDLVRYAETFVAVNESPHRCVLTGGEANLRVEHDGQEYYFCCLLCIDTFKRDPEGTLARRQDKK